MSLSSSSSGGRTEARNRPYARRPHVRRVPVNLPAVSRDKCAWAKIADPNPGHWEEYGPFQQVKHDLIRCYLNGWYPTLSWTGRVLYVDMVRRQMRSRKPSTIRSPQRVI